LTKPAPCSCSPMLDIRRVTRPASIRCARQSSERAG
jgi:hypothetical protein